MQNDNRIRDQPVKKGGKVGKMWPADVGGNGARSMKAFGFFFWLLSMATYLEHRKAQQ
jgi:hypothetical protein